MSRHALRATAVAGNDEADAIVVEDGRISALTQGRHLADIPTTDHGPATIVPAFTDSHLHPLGYAALLNGLSLKGASTPVELADLLGEAAAKLAPRQALMAQRLDETALGRLPTRHDLDRAVGDTPAIAYRYCGHVAVVNTPAMRLAGIDERTADPPGGSLDRDATGYPTGVLRETAVDLVGPVLEPLLAPPSPEQVIAALEALVATGIIHLGAMAAAGQPLWCGVGDELRRLCDVASDLPLDVDVMVIADTPEGLQSAAHLIERSAGRLRFWGWKSFADGSLGGHTAAMWSPYADVDTCGTLRLDLSRAGEMAKVALDMGGVVAMHAIGDRAVDETLDLFDRLLAEGAEPGRLRVEHASVVSAPAIQRFAATGVIASIQPSFLSSESGWVPSRLGEGRPPYRFGSMRRAGVEMIGGSDCPVERPDPLAGIAAAVRREGWNDGEELTVEEALALYTTAPARHFRRPPPLVEGSPADLVMVEGDLGSSEARVVAVYSRGEQLPLRPLPWPG